MVCYLIRHGKDDETVRGGWSQQPLTEEGIQQAEILGDYIASNRGALEIKQIYSSDLPRTMQTAQRIADRLDLPIIPVPEFREVNNGDLAGMKNDLALERYPGLFWNLLEWEQCYPGGESPKHFYERIRTAWEAFSQMILSRNENVLLVTHGGVIHVIRSILEGRPYSNKQKQRRVDHAEMITMSYQNDVWKEKL